MCTAGIAQLVYILMQVEHAMQVWLFGNNNRSISIQVRGCPIQIAHRSQAPPITHTPGLHCCRTTQIERLKVGTVQEMRHERCRKSQVSVKMIGSNRNQSRDE